VVVLDLVAAAVAISGMELEAVVAAMEPWEVLDPPLAIGLVGLRATSAKVLQEWLEQEVQVRLSEQEMMALVVTRCLDVLMRT
jgi:hypothetical protein